jgi:hypothetical protein
VLISCDGSFNAVLASMFMYSSFSLVCLLCAFFFFFFFFLVDFALIDADRDPERQETKIPLVQKCMRLVALIPTP